MGAVDRYVHLTKETAKVNYLKINFQIPKKEQSTGKWGYLVSIILNAIIIKYSKDNISKDFGFASTLSLQLDCHSHKDVYITV